MRGGTDGDSRLLSAEWAGETRFDIIEQSVSPGNMYHQGRMTRSLTTSRTERVRP